VIKTRFQANQGGHGGAGYSRTGSNSLTNHNNVHNATSNNKTQKLTNNSKLTTRLNCYSNILLRNNHFSHGTVVCPPTTRQLMANMFNFEPHVKQTHRHIFPSLSATVRSQVRPDRVSIYSQFK
jgi:hypothetical protein